MIKGLHISYVPIEIVLSAALFFSASYPSFAQDPAVSYIRAGRLMAETSRKGELERYREALEILTRIKKEHPDWNAFLVKERIQECRQQVDSSPGSEDNITDRDELLAHARQIEIEEVEIRKRSRLSSSPEEGDNKEPFSPSLITFNKDKPERTRNYAGTAVEHYNRAKDMAQQKDYNGAIEELKESIFIEGAYVEAFTAMGEIYEAIGKDKIAIEAYLSALDIDNDSTKAHCGIGNILTRQGIKLEQENKLMEAWAKYQNAVLEYKRATWADINFAPAYYGIGVAYSRLGKHSDATYYWKKTIETAGKDSELGKKAKNNIAMTGMVL